MKDFIATQSKLIIVAIIAAAIALPAGYALRGSGSQEVGSIAESQSSLEHSTMMETYELPDGIAVPSVTDLAVTKDNKAGWNISFDTQNFTFTPEDASTEHVENQGHAHLHIDGVKVNRLYSHNYYVADLEPGAHTFSVYLNTNDHKEYVVDGLGTGIEVVVTQEIAE